MSQEAILSCATTKRPCMHIKITDVRTKFFISRGWLRGNYLYRHGKNATHRTAHAVGEKIATQIPTTTVALVQWYLLELFPLIIMNHKRIMLTLVFGSVLSSAITASPIPQIQFPSEESFDVGLVMPYFAVIS